MYFTKDGKLGMFLIKVIIHKKILFQIWRRYERIYRQRPQLWGPSRFLDTRSLVGNSLNLNNELRSFQNCSFCQQSLLNSEFFRETALSDTLNLRLLSEDYLIEFVRGHFACPSTFFWSKWTVALRLSVFNDRGCLIGKR